MLLNNIQALCHLLIM